MGIIWVSFKKQFLYVFFVFYFVGYVFILQRERNLLSFFGRPVIVVNVTAHWWCFWKLLWFWNLISNFYFFLFFIYSESGFPFIVVGQPLWFRLHVRCSFYHSIHKDNGGLCGTQTQVKKLRDLERKDYQ